MRRRPRDLLHLSLAGLGERVHALARARGTTAAALGRQALRQLLADVPPPDLPSRGDPVAHADGTVVRMALSLSATHLAALTERARAAEMSRGTFVAGLLDGQPPAPLPPDHAQAIAALARSTDHLAAIGTDLNALMRLLTLGQSVEVQRYREALAALIGDVRSHLALAAPLVAALKSARRWK